LADSLSLGSGAVIVGLISAVCAAIIARLQSNVAAWGLAVILPYFVAHTIYALPGLLGADTSEFDSWELLFVVPWYITGLLASLAIVGAIRSGK
jgi:hypothetical protein